MAAGRRRLLRALAGSVAVPLAYGPAAFAQSAAPVILVLGDSLSAEYGLARDTGWVALLRDRLSSAGHDARVVNASISGDTTAGGRARLPALLERHSPSIVVIELGGNDALRGLDLESTRANLAAMIESARQRGASVLLVGMRVPPNYGRAYTEQFAQIFVELARTLDVALVPFLLEPLIGREGMFQSDRIHPTEAAQPLMLDTVWPELSTLLPAPGATR